MSRKNQIQAIEFTHLFSWRAHKNRKIFLLMCWLLIALSGSPSIPVRAQNPKGEKPSTPQDQPLKLKTELIEVRAVVTDKQGNLVKNLTKEDFEISENNKNQTISFFSAENLSQATLSIDRVQPAARDKGSAPAAKEVSRTVVIFVDTLHLSTASFLRLKETLLTFINEQLTDRDLAAVVTSSGNLGIFSQFTKNKAVLRNALDRISTSSEIRRSSLYSPFLAARVEQDVPNAIETAMNIVRAEERLPDDEHTRALVRALTIARARQILSEASYRRRLTLLTMNAIAEQLARMPGQRLMLALSDGFTMLDSGGIADPIDLQAAVSRAVRSGVVIYTFAAKGLRTSTFYDVSSGRFEADSGLSGSMFAFISAGDNELENGLTQIAKATGGEAFLTTNDLTGALGKTLNDNNFYYALSYYPSNEEKEAFRRIKVQVKNHPEYKIRAQNGYLASELKRDTNPEIADPHKRLLQAMNAPLVTTEIAIDVSADFANLQTDGAQAALVVYTDGKNLKYVEEEKSFIGKLELMVEVLNSAGRSESITQDNIQLKLSAEQHKQAAQNVYRYNKGLQLKPGLYQIRVGVRDEQSDLIGTTSTWIEIPDLGSKKLFLGSLTLAKSSTNPAPVDKEAEQTAVSLPTVRNGISLYRNRDEIVFVSRIYNASKSSSPLKARIQILQGTKVVFEDAWHPLSSMTLKKEGEAVVAGAQLKLQAFKPGTYEFRLVVADENLKNPLVTGKLFEIEP